MSAKRAQAGNTVQNASGNTSKGGQFIDRTHAKHAGNLNTDARSRVPAFWGALPDLPDGTPFEVAFEERYGDYLDFEERFGIMPDRDWATHIIKGHPQIAAEPLLANRRVREVEHLPAARARVTLGVDKDWIAQASESGYISGMNDFGEFVMRDPGAHLRVRENDRELALILEPDAALDVYRDALAWSQERYVDEWHKDAPDYAEADWKILETAQEITKLREGRLTPGTLYTQDPKKVQGALEGLVRARWEARDATREASEFRSVIDIVDRQGRFEDNKIKRLAYWPTGGPLGKYAEAVLIPDSYHKALDDQEKAQDKLEQASEAVARHDHETSGLQTSQYVHKLIDRAGAGLNREVEQSAKALLKAQEWSVQCADRIRKEFHRVVQIAERNQERYETIVAEFPDKAWALGFPEGQAPPRPEEFSGGQG